MQAAEAVYSVLKAKGKINGVPYGEVCLYKANLERVVILLILAGDDIFSGISCTFAQTMVGMRYVCSEMWYYLQHFYTVQVRSFQQIQ